MTTIETKRLILRRFKASDWKELHDYLSDQNVVKFEPYVARSEEDCKKEAEMRSHDKKFWAVCQKSSEKLIGNIYFANAQPEFSTWEIGYVFNAKYQGKGYATESCKAIINFAVRNLGTRRIVANCSPENIKSWTLLERLKFRREAHFIKNIYFSRDSKGKPIWQDTYEYAILADEWEPPMWWNE